MYDLIIIWAGSAGLPAGMYASRYHLKNLIIGEIPGGALGTSHCVENYPGVISAPGKEIMDNFAKHAESAGSEILQERVESVDKVSNEKFVVKTTSKKEFEAKKILLATGNEYKKIGVPGEDTFHGKGVSYCATCDGNFYQGADIAVIGGGNTAITEALYLAEIAKTVHILIRGERARAEKVWMDKAKKYDNIIFHYQTETKEITGDVIGVTGIQTKTNETIPVEWVFVAIGSTPFTGVVDDLQPHKDEDGCLIVNERQETNIPWLYAAGDVTTNSNKFRQTIMSAAEGCLAADSIHEDLL